MLRTTFPLADIAHLWLSDLEL